MAKTWERLPSRCAWRNCTKSCGPEALPLGWIMLVTFRETATPGKLDFLRDRTERDAVLCPDHAAALEACLIPLGPRRLADA